MIHALIWAFVASTIVGQVAPVVSDAPVPPPLASVPTTTAPAGPPRFDDPEFVIGSSMAPVTVVEYFSNTCAHCAAFDRDTFPYVEARYIQTGRVRYVMREIPTAPTELSGMGFLIARCAGKDRYLPTIRDMFRNQDALFKAVDVRPILIAIGGRAGLSVDQMQDCLDDDAAFERLNGRLRAAVAAGVEGTPTFVINGRMLMPGDRLGGSVYEGGELNRRQFDVAVSWTGPSRKERAANRPTGK